MELIIEEEVIRIMAVDFEHGLVDWRRTTGGYLGVCTSEIGEVDFISVENNIRVALGAELQGQDNPLAKANE
ncbi:hypothetical protein SAMN04489760_14816 [Syntrophus gentianae]|uniref:Uncharacterized protein n=1 Tax=Syntrophus gentianae TaxID=43775 RepID=A0A1H8B8F4_9BACT|nr:hypothetical protein [Syntrophus gentianae]SEM79132.1 hypothetical protein SAMN04489760_14816 [Syntrophus gentianae]